MPFLDLCGEVLTEVVFFSFFRHFSGLWYSVIFLPDSSSTLLAWAGGREVVEGEDEGCISCCSKG